MSRHTFNVRRPLFANPVGREVQFLLSRAQALANSQLYWSLRIEGSKLTNKFCRLRRSFVSNEIPVYFLYIRLQLQ
jgi:hypothetical protein